MHISLASTITIILWAVFAFSFYIERSKYRNCYFLFAALIATVFSLTFIAGEHQPRVLMLIFIVFFFALLAVPVFLIVNGITMIVREGRSLANLLSLIFGIVIGLGELSTFLAVLIPAVGSGNLELSGRLYTLSAVSLFISVSVIYLSLSFLMFMLYCIFLQIIPRKRDFDYIIIHGAGLLDGERVSKLLSDRIDKAIFVYHKDPTPPVLIPSGGKGSDENISEAEAMTKYLLGEGIPAEKIIQEDTSTTTYENLVNSKAIIDARDGSKYVALVTSNYHVYRALRYCRKVGLKCTGIGSHVAFYYWPSALIREFIAINVETKHLVCLIIGWLIFIMPVALAFIGA